MKKFLALTMMLLLMAGVVTAGYVQIRVAGSDSAYYVAQASDVLSVEVKVYGFSDQLLDTLGAMSFNIDEELGGDAVAGVASNNQIRYNSFDSSTAGTLENSNGTLIAGVNMSKFGVWADVDYSNRVLTYSFDYTVGDVENGFARISLANQGSGLSMFRDPMGNDITAGVDVSSVTIIPEPVTLALLGLGGLFIRRRK